MSVNAKYKIAYCHIQKYIDFNFKT